MFTFLAHTGSRAVCDHPIFVSFAGYSITRHNCMRQQAHPFIYLMVFNEVDCEPELVLVNFVQLLKESASLELLRKPSTCISTTNHSSPYTPIRTSNIPLSTIYLHQKVFLKHHQHGHCGTLSFGGFWPGFLQVMRLHFVW